MSRAEKFYDICLKNNYINRNQCGISTIWSLISLQDFDRNFENPFSMVYLSWRNYTDNTSPQHSEIISFCMTFFSVCYAYSLFRLVIDLAIIYYAFKKIGMLLNDAKERMKEYKQLIPEIRFYEKIIYFGVCIQSLKSFHNFVVWRGLQYYSSAQDDFYQTEIKPPRICNCIYDPSLYKWSSSFSQWNGSEEKSCWLVFMYVSWICLESLGMMIIYFSVFTLSRINRKGKSGMELLKGTIRKSIILGVSYGVMLLLLIFYFDMPIFYRFINYEVLSFWFFWKVVGFMFLCDKLHSKYWLFQNLNIRSLHNHAKQWMNKLNNIKQKNERIDSKKLEEALQRQRTEINEVIQQNKENIINHLNTSIKSFYDKLEIIIQNSSKKNEKSKLKTNWQDYLNYVLGLNLLGLIGFFFLMVDASIIKDGFDPKKNGPSDYYFVGIFFCYAEIIIFDLSHGIFLLHCFFIELLIFLNKHPNLSENIFPYLEIDDSQI